MLDQFLQEPRVAYFSMEMALQADVPTYAGGLGILAGDTLRSAADLSVPMVGVSLVSRAGYFRQEIDPQGQQLEHEANWDPARVAQPLDAKIVVRIEDRAVWVGAWLYIIKSQEDGPGAPITEIPVVLLDTNQVENRREDAEITHYLYGGDEAYRLKQEMVLGIGGVRMLRALDFDVSTYHMNEGHSALLGIELLRRVAYPAADRRPGEPAYDLPRVRSICRFTTHTPVEAGHDQFSYDLVRRLFASSLGDELARHTPSDSALPAPIDFGTLSALAGSDGLNMTRLALNLSDFVNGVAKRHAEVSAKMYPGYRVRAITNGVHPYTWTSPSFRAVYDRYVPGWCNEPELLGRADTIPQDAIAAAHSQAKQALIERVRALSACELRSDVLTLGFARRMTAYKRPDLLFSDMERLRAIARQTPLQILLAGKAHPRDSDGKRLIGLLHERARSLAGSVAVVFLPDYDMQLAQLLVAGCDVWLNTPLPPLEASGTSGMKAAFNGVPSLSVLDGWWIEGCIEGVTGWEVSDAASLYDKLEHTVAPQYYARVAQPERWFNVMRGAITKNACYFNTHRMMRRYVTESYLR